MRLPLLLRGQARPLQLLQLLLMLQLLLVLQLL
jgi:hypothetical protein